MASQPQSAGIPLKSRTVDLVNKIHAAPTTRDILVGLKDEIQALFSAERMTIFALDTQKQELYSITSVGGQTREIRVPKTFSSIAGFTGMSRQTLNVKDAYDAAELAKLHPRLAFDKRWDTQAGFRTKQVLSVPITFEKFILGVVQLVNRSGGGAFTPDEVAGLEEVAKTLGIAFYNQRKVSAAGKPSKYSYLLSKSAISEADLQAAAAEARVKNCSVEFVLTDKFNVPQAEVHKSLSTFYSVTAWEYTGTETVPTDVRDRLNLDFLRKIQYVPVAKSGREMTVVVSDPHDLTKLDAIKATNLAPIIDFQVGIAEDIKTLIDKSFGAAAEADDGADFDSEELIAETDGEEENQGGPDEQDSAVVKLCNLIIRDAYKCGASDIHVEPYGDKASTVIRFRTDGECKIYKEVSPEYRSALISRLKIMARLDISEKRKPQDGKIRFRSKKGTIELRVATIPTSGGNEDIVMRILAASEPLPLEKMGFSPRNIEQFKVALQKPYGLILVVGPTGSGKTTTLHSGLGFINTEDLKIWTVEDPVEITQRGLRQVQMHAKIGLTFATAMRAFLRADPDVIMVGEMRDRETAQTGIEASLTGHLVLSTLHTNSAAETITRLLDMEIDPFSFADALICIMAQRLVRTLCSKCKTSYAPDADEFQDLVKSYGAAWWDKTGIKHTPEFKLGKPVGCDDCAMTGYRGRMGIHELIMTTPALREMVQNKAPIANIHEQAMKDGMTTLLQDGVIKACQGLTTLAQVRTVCMK
jgi:type II secretory ATPase GspE/PulE/Tfp pilus assembly ATPase PilB-like protein